MLSLRNLIGLALELLESRERALDDRGALVVENEFGRFKSETTPGRGSLKFLTEFQIPIALVLPRKELLLTMPTDLRNLANYRATMQSHRMALIGPTLHFVQATRVVTAAY